MPDPDEITTIVMDAVAQVCSLALGGGRVFAAGTTDPVTDADPDVVPLADDFIESVTGDEGVVTVTLGPWRPPMLPGHVRETVTCLGAIWRRRVPLAENMQRLYGDRDRLIRAFVAHARAFEHVGAIQSAVLMGGPGIKARAIPRRGGAENTALFLTLPFTVEVKLMYTLVAQPA